MTTSPEPRIRPVLPRPESLEERSQRLRAEAKAIDIDLGSTLEIDLAQAAERCGNIDKFPGISSAERGELAVIGRIITDRLLRLQNIRAAQ